MEKASSSNAADTSHPITAVVYFLHIQKLIAFSPVPFA